MLVRLYANPSCSVDLRMQSLSILRDMANNPASHPAMVDAKIINALIQCAGGGGQRQGGQAIAWATLLGGRLHGPVSQQGHLACGRRCGRQLRLWHG